MVMKTKHLVTYLPRAPKYLLEECHLTARNFNSSEQAGTSDTYSQYKHEHVVLRTWDISMKLRVFGVGISNDWSSDISSLMMDRLDREVSLDLRLTRCFLIQLWKSSSAPAPPGQFSKHLLQRIRPETGTSLMHRVVLSHYRGQGLVLISPRNNCSIHIGTVLGRSIHKYTRRNGRCIHTSL